MVIQPEFLFVNKHMTKYGAEIEDQGIENKSRDTNDSVTFCFKEEKVKYVALGYILSVVAGVGVSAIVLVVKKFPFLGENMLHTSFWSVTFGIAVSAFFDGCI